MTHDGLAGVVIDTRMLARLLGYPMRFQPLRSSDPLPGQSTRLGRSLRARQLAGHFENRIRTKRAYFCSLATRMVWLPYTIALMVSGGVKRATGE